MLYLKSFIIFIFTISMYIQADSTETIVKEILPGLEKALESNLEKATQRKNINLELESEIKDSQVRIFLSQRSERDTVFQVNLEIGNTVNVNAVVLYPEEKELVEKIIPTFFPGKSFLWNFQVGCIAWGIAKAPLVNIYVFPKEEAGDNLATQIVYGTPFIILEAKEQESFFRIKSESDAYIGWVHLKDIKMVSSNDWAMWVSKSAVYNNVSVQVNSQEIPAGARFSLESIEETITVSSFDGQKFSFPKEKFALDEDIIATAKKFLPEEILATQKYLWGGTSAPELDCSGFVQLTYKLHNILLPRDADQQFQYSEKIDAKDAQPGDLIFFSKHGKHPTHVGMHLDNNLFIHCSASGSHSGVKINNLQGDSDYDKYLREIYYASGRIQK